MSDVTRRMAKRPQVSEAQEVHDLKQMVRALMDEWTVERRSLYDEEGVEGWCWTTPSGDEFYEIGIWDELPPWPDGANEKLGEPR
jgi:hypothetical protein